MINPLVSIIIPVYGVEKYIARCAKSVLEQTYHNIEYIFVNDCSKDRSIEVLEETIKQYPDKAESVRVVNHEHNLGLAAARNTGVDAAKGEWLMHVDSDDYLEPTAVEKSVKKATKDNADMVIFGIVQEFKKTSTPIMPPHVSSKEEYMRLIVQHNIPTRVCGGLMKVSLYKDNDIHAIPGVNFAEDYSVYPKLAYYAKKISFIYEPLYHYIRYNEGSYTGHFNPKVISNSFAAMDEIESFFNKQGQYQLECRVSRLRFQAWALNTAISFSNDKELLDRLINQVSFTNDTFKYLSKFHKIVVYLAVHKKKKTLSSFIKSARFVYNKIRPFLKRN
ncbi:MAG: glycosyltransferase [Prevotella sp.]|jgi:glycosyltransferase involved in cell wall biosynthesis|nr:glycosyltransferase family 2 protein [Prevotella sp.]MCI2088608.1 glycosyltransferase [Prevotella sp.]MCI2125841.1 glycosyltransferase [Prevotella sp.]